MKYARDFGVHFAKLDAFTARDAGLFLKRRGASPGYARLVLHKMVAAGKIRRIAKGAYTYGVGADAVGLAFRPYYYGLQDALSIHGLWEQETNPVVITPRMVRPGLRKFMGSNYVVRRIARGMFFGYGPVKNGGVWVNASDVEKTLVDFAHFRAPLSPQALDEIKQRIDGRKLDGYLKRCSPRTVKTVRKWLGKK